MADNWYYKTYREWLENLRVEYDLLSDELQLELTFFEYVKLMKQFNEDIDD